MAAGVVIEPKSAQVKAIINNIKQAGYAPIRRLMDALIAAKNVSPGNNWAKVQALLGEANTTDAQAVFENLDAALGAMTTANDALAPLDGGYVDG